MIRLPRSRRIRIWQDQHEYAMSYRDWELAVRSGAVSENALVCSRTITDSIWRRLGDMRLFAIWKTFSPAVAFNLDAFRIWAMATKKPSAERIAVDPHSGFEPALPPLMGIFHPLLTAMSIVSAVVLDTKMKRFRFVCSGCDNPVGRWETECCWCRAPLRPGFVLEDMVFGTLFFTDEDDDNER